MASRAPTEVWDVVCDIVNTPPPTLAFGDLAAWYQSATDRLNILKSLRLVNHAAERAAARVLFLFAEADMRPQGVRNLNSLAGSRHADLVKFLYLRKVNRSGAKSNGGGTIEDVIVPGQEISNDGKTLEGDKQTLSKALRKFPRLKCLILTQPFGNETPKTSGGPSTDFTPRFIYRFRKLLESLGCLDRLEDLELDFTKVSDFDYFMRDLRLEPSVRADGRRGPVWTAPQALRDVFDRLGRLTLRGCGNPSTQTYRGHLRSDREIRCPGAAMFMIASLARNVRALEIYITNRNNTNVPLNIVFASGGKLEYLIVPQLYFSLPHLERLLRPNLSTLVVIGAISEWTNSEIILSDDMMNLLASAPHLTELDRELQEGIISMCCVAARRADLAPPQIQAATKLLARLNQNRKAEGLPEWDPEAILRAEEKDNEEAGLGGRGEGFIADRIYDFVSNTVMET